MAFAVPAAEVADAAAAKAGQKAAARKAAKTAPAPTSAGPAPKKPAAGPAPKKPAAGGTGGTGLHLPRAPKVGAWLMTGDIKLLTAEYVACVVVLGAGTLLAPQGSKDGTVRAMVKFTALSAVFFLLALVASAGKGAARGATALGALITAAYLFTSSDVHDVAAWAALFFDPKGDVSVKQPGGSGPVAAGAGTGPVAGPGVAPGPANGQSPSLPGTLAPGGFGQVSPGGGGGFVG